jgi:lysophospholipase L1-like esterase
MATLLLFALVVLLSVAGCTSPEGPSSNEETHVGGSSDGNTSSGSGAHGPSAGGGTGGVSCRGACASGGLASSGAAGSSVSPMAGASSGGAIAVGGTGVASVGGSTGSGGMGTGGAPIPSRTHFKMVIIGSSTAAGEGASDGSRGWVSLLASQLEAQVIGDFRLVNLAVGGYATGDLLSESNSPGNIDDAVDQGPDLLVVALAGSNDLSNGVSTETFLARLIAIRDSAVKQGIPVFFVSTAPKDLSESERQALEDWAGQMRDPLSECWTPQNAAYSPCFVDIFEALASPELNISPELGSGDGIHLNDSGHHVIFEIASEVVMPYVCSLIECR